jgi:hypothetical protein
MSKAPVWITSTLVVTALATPAGAAPVGQVISTCDKMHDAGQTCNYGIPEGGNAIVGCTSNVIFTCPADGSRQCTGTQNPTGQCNEDGTVARLQGGPLRGDGLVNEMTKGK